MKVFWGKMGQHCEYTSFATAFGFAIVAISIYYVMVDGVQFLSNNWAFVFTTGILVGAGGIIWYTVEGKKSLVLPIIFFVIVFSIFLFAPLYYVEKNIICITEPCINFEYRSLVELI